MELFDLYRERAEEDALGAFLWVAAEAPADPPEGPLAGVPIAVKDLFCVEDVPSAAASRILEGYRPPYTATAVDRLAQAGAPVLGKTNMDEFAMGSSTENSGFGPVAQPLGQQPRARRLQRRLGGRRRRGPRARGRSARTPAAPSASRPRCAGSSG